MSAKSQPLLLLPVCCILISLQAISQTKKIWHKSHSGSCANFGKALSGNLFEMEESDFGIPGISKPSYSDAVTPFSIKSFGPVKLLRVTLQANGTLEIMYSKPDENQEALSTKTKYEIVKTDYPISSGELSRMNSKEGVLAVLREGGLFNEAKTLGGDSTQFVNFNFKPSSSKTKKEKK